jgi:tRNA(Ile)-lysidine synthase TilS/MesJ
LIDFDKKTIEKLCKKNKIKYFKDNTNDDISFSKRNLIRKKIIQICEEISNTSKD